MKKLSITVATLLVAFAGSAFAQNATTGITVSQDPAKAAAVEQHAAEIKSQQTTPETKPMGTTHHVKKHQAKKHHVKHVAKKQSANKTVTK